MRANDLGDAIFLQVPGDFPVRVTLDSDVCIDIDQWSHGIRPRNQDRADAIEGLLRLAKARRIDWARASDLLRREWSRGRSSEAIAQRDSLLDDLGVASIGTPARFDITAIGASVFGIDDTELRQLFGVELPGSGDNLAAFEKAVSDVDHLLAHAVAGRCWFLMWNRRDFIDRGRRAELARLGLLVGTPQDAVATLNP